MEKEITDTRSNGVVPGEYTFTVMAEPVNGSYKPGSNYYDFEFGVGLDLARYSEKIPVWLVAPLLRALGCQEIEPNIFSWDKASVIGTMFDASIVMEENPKSGKFYRKMKNPVGITGFPKNKNITTPEVINEDQVPF